MELAENILPDDYPVYCGYVYVADGKPVTCWISGTVSDLKKDIKADEIKNCDIFGRQKLLNQL